MKQEYAVTQEVADASRFSSATLCEAAGKTGSLPAGIKPLASGMKVCGRAVPVHSPPGDNIMLHQAILTAKPGDVLVVEVSGMYDAGYWGDIMTLAAQERGIQGLVIDGCVRDKEDIVASEFPVFSRGLCIQGTTKHGGGTINEPILIGQARIQASDLIVGDDDGVVVIPEEHILSVLEKAKQRAEHEEQIRQQLKAGKNTMEIYGWK
ncbi:4-hydroxy-4-methyl-2-oxoglutarate aldolase [Alteribacillus persepolensis]|uniref:Putative 4-hydroxy-4-methyl-2-oxoglutarate aldolase n=1 Tax=Alteribacillus persepolensis TaxID=568899 RepID=A0A1G8AVQ3_9BACI|nr:4-carboxy-4-hydroxy-2-oxoadipate aldolase/oxaloacetate decarboxylase [Alteribacillus persepolensis]SDH25041.1 4-hydroxy-4-methyl-2-oxoglutarate aldolase [Alteribacillus persepolensis]